MNHQNKIIIKKYKSIINNEKSRCKKITFRRRVLLFLSALNNSLEKSDFSMRECKLCAAKSEA